ncbi:MAG: LysR substrate-binding domain-containing protein [Blastocatellia bacterium]
MDDYNLYPLHIFRVVARLGGVTRAAETLHVSQPAISAHLRALEQRCGRPLFERTPRGMRLTEAGAAVLDQANRLFALYEEIPGLLDALEGQVRGGVVVACSSTPAAWLLPARLQAFQRQYPGTEPELLVGDSAEVLKWLRDYRAALGVIGELQVDDEWIRLPIASDELRLVAAAGDSLARARRIGPARLRDRTLFLREEGSSTRAGAQALLGETIRDFRRVVEIRNAEAVKQAVISGLGLAVMSSWATGLEEKAGLLRPVSDRAFRLDRRFYLVRKKDRELRGVAAALWGHLAEGTQESDRNQKASSRLSAMMTF